MDIVDFSDIKKHLKKTPKQVIQRLQRWSLYIESIGLIQTRKIPGLHDEPLKGQWKGYRSIRLGHQWRAIYKLHKNTRFIVKLKEITPHEY